MKNSRFAYALASISLAFTVGCGGGEDPIDPPADGNDQPAVCGSADAEARVLEIFVGTCGTSNCHDANAPVRNLDLVSADVASRLVGVTSTCNGLPYIEAGNPEGSFIVNKVTSSPECGQRMPFGPPLSAEDVACFEEYAMGLTALVPADHDEW